MDDHKQQPSGNSVSQGTPGYGQPTGNVQQTSRTKSTGNSRESDSPAPMQPGIPVQFDQNQQGTTSTGPLLLNYLLYVCRL